MFICKVYVAAVVIFLLAIQEFTEKKKILTF